MAFFKNPAKNPASRKERKEKMSAAAIPIRFESPQEETRSLLRQATLIRLKPESSVAGFELLFNNGQVQALPDDTYVVGPEHIALLDQAGIEYELASK